MVVGQEFMRSETGLRQLQVTAEIAKLTRQIDDIKSMGMRQAAKLLDRLAELRVEQKQLIHNSMEREVTKPNGANRSQSVLRPVRA